MVAYSGPVSTIESTFPFGSQDFFSVTCSMTVATLTQGSKREISRLLTHHSKVLCNCLA